MSVVTPIGLHDASLSMYDVSGEHRVVVKIDGVHIVEDGHGTWTIFERPGRDRREFTLLGEAVSAALALARKPEI